MNADRKSTERPELAPETVTRFLELGVERNHDALSPLVARLLRSDGQRWMQSAISRPPIGSLGSARAQFCDGRASIEDLRKLKDACKRAMRPSGNAQHGGGNRDEQIVAMLGYFVAIAAALAHHGERITTRPRTELDPMLLDLAEVMPRAWSDLFSRSAVAREQREEE